MLDAILDPKRHIDYTNQGAYNQKTPGRLLIASGFFYQAETCLADAGMGFFDKAVRGKAYFKMGGQVGAEM